MRDTPVYVGLSVAVLLTWTLVFFSFDLLKEFDDLDEQLRDLYHDFKLSTDEAWKELMAARFTLPHRRRRAIIDSANTCNCGTPASNCPAGPPGRKGQSGNPGVNGEPGSPGNPGPQGEAMVFERITPSECVLCEAGPPGPPGLPGPPGPSGEPGRDAKDGANGKDGKPGVKGPRGDKGLQGLPGESGKPGDQGKSGVKHVSTPGPPGLAGAPGTPGDVGERGDVGDQGQTGVAGPAGPQGENGHAGQNGLPGEVGRQGELGSDATYCPCPEPSQTLLAAIHEKFKEAQKEEIAGGESSTTDRIGTTIEQKTTEFTSQNTNVPSSPTTLVATTEAIATKEIITWKAVTATKSKVLSTTTSIASSLGASTSIPFSTSPATATTTTETPELIEHEIEAQIIALERGGEVSKEVEVSPADKTREEARRKKKRRLDTLDSRVRHRSSGLIRRRIAV